MEPAILIKKYGNRRLYDSSSSSYVTLADVEQLLQAGKDIRVVDAKSGEDLTRSILVQIILEREDSREVLPMKFLKQVIRLGNSPLKGWFAQTLLSYLEAFSNSQSAFSARLMEAFSPGTMMNPFAAFAPPAPSGAPGGFDERRGEELDGLRAELTRTRAALDELLRERKNDKPKRAATKKRAKKKAKTARAAKKSRG